MTIVHLDTCRRQVERVCTWITQDVRITAFYGTAANAVKSQLWLAISVDVLVAIVTTHLTLDRSLDDMLHMLRVTLFEQEERSRKRTIGDVHTGIDRSGTKRIDAMVHRTVVRIGVA